MILADKIMEERKKNGWSQEELAQKLNVSRQAVSKWESAGAVPDLQKVMQLSDLFGVSTDYLLKENVLPEQTVSISCVDVSGSVRKVSMEEANDFLSLKRKNASRIADGVTLCILSPVLFIILAAMADGKMSGITEGLAAGIGLSVLLGMVAAAVFMFITCGIRDGRFEYMEKEAFETQYGVSGMVKEKRNAYESTFTLGIAIGVVLCILAAVPVLIVASMEVSDLTAVVFVGVLLAFIAFGVNLIVRVSIIRESFDTILQEGDFTKSSKEANKRLEAFTCLYWGIVTAVYLAWSFYTMHWGTTWIVWPVSAVAFGAVSGFLKLRITRDSIKN